MTDHYRGRYSEKGSFLGKGAYGVVCQAKALEDVNKNIKKGQNVAIKTISRIFQNRHEAKRLLRELNILQLFHGHTCIVQLLDIIPPLPDVQSFVQLSLVFDCADTDLKQVIKSNQKFTSLHVEYIMYQLCNSCLYMHSAGIVHRDLKPANILINSDCSIKVCDFGLARGINDEESADATDLMKTESIEDCDDYKETKRQGSRNSEDNSNGAKDGGNRTFKKEKRKQAAKQREPTKHVVTRWYRAPEVILLQLKQEHLPAIDMWSVGCIFGELLQMNDRFCKDHTQRKCLFPGSTCWPLSGKDPFSKSDRGDQLNVIFSKLGSPTEEEIQKIENKEIKEVLLENGFIKPCPIQEIFPAFPSDTEECRKYIENEKKIRRAIDLMLRLLQFDVEKRATAEEALKHKYFYRVKEPQLEVQHKPIRFEFEEQSLDREQIREMIVNVVNVYNDKNSLK
jgi:mitogen-activated protein kinase 1/3